jgi:hypothetical protein
MPYFVEDLISCVKTKGHKIAYIYMHEAHFPTPSIAHFEPLIDKSCRCVETAPFKSVVPQDAPRMLVEKAS